MTLPPSSAATDSLICTKPSASTTAPQLLSGLRQCVEHYDGFLIDLWGVLHDGAAPFDGAVDALRQLRAAGKKVVLLSNSSDNTPQAIKRLRGIGFGAELYDVLITSGALVGVALRDDPTIWLPGKRNKIFMIGASALAMQYNAQNLDLVTEPEDAGLILNGWYAATIEECAEWHDDMRAWVALGLPMVCMNPDLEVIHLGEREACPGTFAAEYARLGGRVHYYGKPYAPAYHAAVAAMALPPTAKLAMIGDNMLTDIKGGTDFGIDTILIAGGVHRAMTGQAWGDLPAPAQLQILCAAYGISPTVVLGRMEF